MRSSSFDLTAGDGQQLAEQVDPGVLGGFKWSSQHLESEVKDGTTARLDGDADGASGDAVARATSGSPRCREAVLVEDR